MGNRTALLVGGALAVGGLAMGGAILLRGDRAPVIQEGRRVEALDGEVAALREEVRALREEVRSLPSKRVDLSVPVLPGAPPPAASGPGLETLLPEGTPSERLREAEALARSIREKADAERRNAAATAARQVQASMEEERRFLQDERRGGTMAMLRDLAKKPVHLPDLVASPERFEALFTRHVTGPSLTNADWDPKAPFADGTTVTLSAGVHSWDAAGYQHRDAFPKDVLLRGAGMDATLLRLNGIRSRHEIHSLTFEDLTLDCSNEYFSDLRSENPVTIRMRRTRVVGFDMAAGGSVMFGARTGAFYAEDSRFEAGYARVGPGSGNLFRVGDGLLVRMDRCALRGPFSSVYAADDNATYLFSGCAFVDMASRSRGGFETPPRGVRFEDCAFAYEEKDEPWNTAERRSLSDFNPAWR